MWWLLGLCPWGRQETLVRGSHRKSPCLSMSYDGTVAPYAGAWIETFSEWVDCAPEGVAPYAGAWIETSGWAVAGALSSVAPYAGAWIETSSSRAFWAHSVKSRPTRARGLKPMVPILAVLVPVVAPYAGAWIETPRGRRPRPSGCSRALRGRVD